MLKKLFSQGKTTIYLLLLLLLFILPASCNNDKDHPPAIKQDTASRGCSTIAILLPEIGTLRYEQEDRPKLEREISKRLAPSFQAEKKDLTLLYFNANSNKDHNDNLKPKQQIEQAKIALDKGACLLIVDVESLPEKEKDSLKSKKEEDSLKPGSEIVKLAHQRKVEVIAYDRYIDDEKNYADYLLTFDSIKVGELHGKYIRDEYNDRKNNGNPYGLKEYNNKYVMINGDRNDKNTELLRKGFKYSLKKFFNDNTMIPITTPPLKLKEEEPIDGWDKDIAARVMKEVLAKNPDLKIAWVANDGMAKEIITTSLDNKKGKIIITGQDGDSGSLDFVKKGWQSITVCKNVQDLAKKTAILVERLVTGKIENRSDESELDNAKPKGDYEDDYKEFKGEIYISDAVEAVTKKSETKGKLECPKS